MFEIGGVKVMKKSPSCVGCVNYKGAGCFYILADKVELCPKVIKDYEKFRSDDETCPLKQEG